MPELPEVETVSRALRPHLLGKKIVRVETYTDWLRSRLDIQKHEEILYQGICAVVRRAKYIIIEFENLSVILMHLGMTGSCRIESANDPRELHDHVNLFLDNETVWRFNDPRKFGMIRVLTIAKPGILPSEMENIPPEPLSSDFSTLYLFNILRNRKKAIKSVIMDNRLVAGVGNIYANEALFQARINPALASCSLTRKRTSILIQCIRKVLIQAIEAGGTTISDFRTVNGSEGKFSLQLHVYGKEGEICSGCEKKSIVKRIISGRSSFFCPSCQNR